MSIQWSRILLGVFGSLLFSILALGVVIGLVIAFSAAESIEDVLALRFFAFTSSIMIGLGCVWGGFVFLRPLAEGQTLHGFLIGLSVGIFNFLFFSPSAFIGGLITLLLAVTGAVLGARLAQINPRRTE